MSERVRVFFYKDHGFRAERQEALASLTLKSPVSQGSGNWSFFDRGHHKAATSANGVVVNLIRPHDRQPCPQRAGCNIYSKTERLDPSSPASCLHLISALEPTKPYYSNKEKKVFPK